MTFDPQRALSQITGLGTGNGGLAKLTVEYEVRFENSYSGSVTALFNPTELSFTRAVTWSQAPLLVSEGRYVSSYGAQDFVQRNPATLTVSLFIDTYEARTRGLASHVQRALIPVNPLTSAPEATSATHVVDQILRLGQLDQELHRPPRCRLKWGTWDVFWGVLTNVQHSYTMFMPDGMPVRAKVTCTFTEHGGEYYARGAELHSADVAKAHVVRRGETLHTIAAEEYGDPSLWRVLARANAIRNPRELEPGTRLSIPVLRP
jgi:nucleoid-associated protein YgaU